MPYKKKVEGQGSPEKHTNIRSSQRSPPPLLSREEQSDDDDDEEDIQDVVLSNP